MHWLLTTVVASLAAIVAAVSTNGHHDLFIGLHPEDHDTFERTLYDISNPHHKRYGKHLSGVEARALLQPASRVTEDVKRWLLEDLDVRKHHIEDRGSYIQARVPAHHAKSLSKRSSAGYVQIPDHIRRHVSHIQRMDSKSSGAINSFGKRANQRRNVQYRHSSHSLATRDDGFDPDPDLEVCKETLTPACIFKIYNIDAPPADPHPKTLYGIAGFRNQTAQNVEFEEFISRFAPYAEGGNFTTKGADGGENPQGDQYPSSEANLNIQYAVGMAFNTSVEYIPIGGEYKDFIPDLDLPVQASAEPYLSLTTHLLSLKDDELPQVVSISYGVSEQHMPFSYANTVCDQIGELGLRGVSVVTSSGNFGAGFSCMSNDGKNTTKYLPGFPQSCPYITAVGGTKHNSPEIVYDSDFDGYSSGGGFSDYWKRPEWQSAAVEDWLEEHGEQGDGYYNESGRAYPDVANFAWGHQIMNHGAVEFVEGTSAASPVFGALITLLNNERFHKGKPPMGFLNPWIYSIGDAGFTDIVEGRSGGCTGQSLSGLPAPKVPDAGWDAVEGWDPVTGFGTPDYGKLKKLACQ